MEQKKVVYRFQQMDNVHEIFIFDEIRKIGPFNWDTWQYDDSETSAKHFKELLDEKLGYPTPISYEDWLAHNHYQEIRPADTKWLYRQEQGYIESMKNITLRELAEQRIGEFRSALRKYIL